MENKSQGQPMLTPGDPGRRMLGYVAYGSGAEPIAIMHEWLGDHSNYLPMLPYLDRLRFTYLIVDLRGYGLSKTMTGQFSASEAAADVLRLMDALGHERFHVVGHSMSAMIAQRIAVDAPKRVKSLIAVTPVPASGLKIDDTVRRRMAQVIDSDTAATEAITARTSGRYGASWLAWKLALARAAATAEAMRGYLDMITQTDFAAEVAGLRVPVLAIVGEHDIAAYNEVNVRRTLGRWFPSFEIAVSREAGHYPMLETPVYLAAHLERFCGAKL